MAPEAELITLPLKGLLQLNEGDFGAGADWLAINVSWEGSYTFTAEINKDREIIALTL